MLIIFIFGGRSYNVVYPSALFFGVLDAVYLLLPIEKIELGIYWIKDFKFFLTFFRRDEKINKIVNIVYVPKNINPYVAVHTVP